MFLKLETPEGAGGRSRCKLVLVVLNVSTHLYINMNTSIRNLDIRVFHVKYSFNQMHMHVWRTCDRLAGARNIFPLLSPLLTPCTAGASMQCDILHTVKLAVNHSGDIVCGGVWHLTPLLSHCHALLPRTR